MKFNGNQQMNNNYKFIAMWDSQGLEYLEELSNLDSDALIAKLSGKKNKTAFNISTMMLRARANSQRSYEIYTFESIDLDKDMVSEMFKADPQVIVNAIREQGHKIYSDYSSANKQLIR